MNTDVATARELLLQWQQLLTRAAADRLSTHPKPLRDPKSLTCWNALLVRGFAEAHRALPENGYDQAATNLLEALINSVWQNGEIAHQYLNGEAEGEGFLDDYSSFGQALLEGFLLTGNSIYFDHAQEIAKSIERIFPFEGAFRVYTPSFEAAWQKQLEIEDNVIPSANSMWAHFFQYLGVIADRNDWKEQAQLALRAVHSKVFRYGPNFSNWLELGLMRAYGAKELVITGSGAKAAAEELQRAHYQPGTLVLFSESASELAHFKGRVGHTLTYYLCSNNTCQLPTTDLNELLKLWKA